MAEGEFRESAKCKYHHLCKLYNNGVLTEHMEVEVCGRGKPVDKNFEPQIPETSKFFPCEEYAHGAGGTCDSYMRYEDSKIVSSLVDHLVSLEKLVDKHGYW